nr:class I histocompatibility antigen, F10 alpha chain-like [Anolis sagrei ordinatus]
MGLLWPLLGWACLCLSLLGGPALALPKGTAAPAMTPGASSHSLHYLYTTLTESSPGLPHFVIVGYVDDQLFYYYDSETRKTVPRVPWMEKVGEADSQYWVGETQAAQNAEAVFRANFAIAQQRYNQSGECRCSSFCCFLLERPVGKVSRKEARDGQETLICQAHGFYPREIDATWTKGEQNMDHETFRKNIAHNFDGTYHTWLSIDIDPKERDLYRCHLDHASLPKPMVLAYEEPGVNMGLIVGVVVGIVVILVVATGIYFILSKCTWIFFLGLILWYFLLEIFTVSIEFLLLGDLSPSTEVVKIGI